eukprot:gene19479-19532_t
MADVPTYPSGLPAPGEGAPAAEASDDGGGGAAAEPEIEKPFTMAANTPQLQVDVMEMKMLERYHRMHDALSADRMHMQPAELDRLISAYNQDVKEYTSAVPPSSDVRHGAERHAHAITALLSVKEVSELGRIIEAVGYRAVVPEIKQNLSQKLTRTHKLCLLHDPDLATWLWQRLQQCKPLVVPPDMQDRECHWVPVGINPCIKFNQYEEGQVFGPHTDAVFESRTAHERTFITVLVYLNAGFEGGHTNFLRSRNGPVVVSVAPVSGSGLVFQHDMLHEATEPSGQPNKMVMQADILFQRAKRTLLG